MDPIGSPGPQDPSPPREGAREEEATPRPARDAREDDAAVPAQIGEDPGTLGPGWEEPETGR